MVKKKIHVVIISQYFPPDVSGGATRAFNYSKCLEQQNYQVTVITAHPHQHGPVTGKYRHKLILKEKMDGLEIIRVWIPSLLHSSVFNSAILNLSFLASSIFPIFSIKPDIIFAFEPNLFSIEGKVIAIIGATGILGTQYVKYLSSLGAKVIIGDVDFESCEKLSGQLNAIISRKSEDI